MVEVRGSNPDLRLAKPALSQLELKPHEDSNNTPAATRLSLGCLLRKKVVDLTRFELVTSRLSAGRSNQLSYRSIAQGIY